MKKKAILIVALVAMVTLNLVGSSNAQPLVFKDDFSGNDFDQKWRSGAMRGFGNSVAVVSEEIRVTENHNYIQTNDSFRGNIRVEVDLRKEGSSDHSNYDFVIELTAIGNTSGGLLFDYSRRDSIDITPFPDENSDCKQGESFFSNSEDNTGTLIFEYMDEYVTLTYTNSEGRTLRTDQYYAGSFDDTALRIWVAAYPESPRFIEEVRVYACEADFDGDHVVDGFDIVAKRSDLVDEYREWAVSCWVEEALCGDVNGDGTTTRIDLYMNKRDAVQNLYQWAMECWYPDSGNDFEILEKLDSEIEQLISDIDALVSSLE